MNDNPRQNLNECQARVKTCESLILLTSTAANLGDNSKVGAFVEIQKGAKIGKNVKISSHTFICEGVTIEDDVFIGHNVSFINDKYPRATVHGHLQTDTDWELRPDAGQTRRLYWHQCDDSLWRHHRRKRHRWRRQCGDHRCPGEYRCGRSASPYCAARGWQKPLRPRRCRARQPCHFWTCKAQYQIIKAEIQQALNRVLDSGMFVLGEEVAAFEEEFAAYSRGPLWHCGQFWDQCPASGLTGGRHRSRVMRSSLCPSPLWPRRRPFSILVPGRCSSILIRALSTMDRQQIEAAITPRTKAISASAPVWSASRYGPYPGDCPAPWSCCH